MIQSVYREESIHNRYVSALRRADKSIEANGPVDLSQLVSLILEIINQDLNESEPKQ